MCNPPAQLSMGTEKMSSDAKTTIPGIQKAEHTNHIASAILKNVHAYILLIDNDSKY